MHIFQLMVTQVCKEVFLFVYAEKTTWRSAVWSFTLLRTWRSSERFPLTSWKTTERMSWWLKKTRRSTLGKSVQFSQLTRPREIKLFLFEGAKITVRDGDSLSNPSACWQTGGSPAEWRSRPKPSWTASMKSFPWSGFATLMKRSWRWGGDADLQNFTMDADFVQTIPL